jgi:hypothetical protein
VRGTSANVLVERNTIELSDVGVYVNHTTTRGGASRGRVCHFKSAHLY